MGLLSGSGSSSPEIAGFVQRLASKAIINSFCAAIVRAGQRGKCAAFRRRLARGFFKLGGQRVIARLYPEVAVHRQGQLQLETLPIKGAAKKL